MHKQASSLRDGWSVGGMAKGAGMLAPALATMLVVVTTDAVVDPGRARRGPARGDRATFDRIDSDGCQSTNDTVAPARLGRLRGRGRRRRARHAPSPRSAPSLARQLIADAEGAHHDIAIEVAAAATEADALEVARSIARNNLFKCAVFGNDPNWGRVLAAVGTTAAAFDPHQLDVSINGVQVCRAGGVGRGPRPRRPDRPRGPRPRRPPRRAEAATVWTNDLTHDYVHENSAYCS